MGITEPRATDLPPPPPPPPPPTYLLSRWLFLRLLGVIYFIAFVSLALQITGLVGEHGILPARTFLERAHALYGGAAYRLFPTLCWLVGGGGGMLRALCWGGAVLALLVVAGVAQARALGLLWLLYLSTSVGGQTFLWFKWDALLLEAGLLAVFYAPTDLVPSRRRERAPSEPMRWLVLWLLFRLMFLSGITKLASRDPTWGDLTALDYHFWTQPLPPSTAWYAHWLPAWTHRGMLLLVLVAELGAPWLIFVSQRLARLRLAACGLLRPGPPGIAAPSNYGVFQAPPPRPCVPPVGARRPRPLAAAPPPGG